MARFVNDRYHDRALQTVENHSSSKWVSQLLYRFASRIHTSDRTDYDRHTTGLVSAEDWQNELNHLVLKFIARPLMISCILSVAHDRGRWKIPRVGFLEQSRRG